MVRGQARDVGGVEGEQVRQAGAEVADQAADGGVGPLGVVLADPHVFGDQLGDGGGLVVGELEALHQGAGHLRAEVLVAVEMDVARVVHGAGARLAEVVQQGRQAQGQRGVGGQAAEDFQRVCPDIVGVEGVLGDADHF